MCLAKYLSLFVRKCRPKYRELHLQVRRQLNSELREQLHVALYDALFAKLFEKLYHKMFAALCCCRWRQTGRAIPPTSFLMLQAAGWRRFSPVRPTSVLLRRVCTSSEDRPPPSARSS